MAVLHRQMPVDRRVVDRQRALDQIERGPVVPGVELLEREHARGDASGAALAHLGGQGSHSVGKVGGGRSGDIPARPQAEDRRHQ